MALYTGSFAFYAVILLAQWIAFTIWAITLTVREREWNRNTSRRIIRTTGFLGSGAAVMIVGATLFIDSEHLFPSGWLVLLGMLLVLGTVPWLSGFALAALIRMATAGPTSGLFSD